MDAELLKGEFMSGRDLNGHVPPRSPAAWCRTHGREGAFMSDERACWKGAFEWERRRTEENKDSSRWRRTGSNGRSDCKLTDVKRMVDSGKYLQLNLSMVYISKSGFF